MSQGTGGLLGAMWLATSIAVNGIGSIAVNGAARAADTRRLDRERRMAADLREQAALKRRAAKVAKARKVNDLLGRFDGHR